jgi:hypothetical protein
MARRSPISLRLFNGYKIASTSYVYDDAGGTADDSGDVDVAALANKAVQVGIVKDPGTISIIKKGQV